MDGRNGFVVGSDQVGPVRRLDFDGSSGLRSVYGDWNWGGGGGGRGRLVIAESVGDGGGGREAESATERGFHLCLFGQA